MKNNDVTYLPIKTLRPSAKFSRNLPEVQEEIGSLGANGRTQLPYSSPDNFKYRSSDIGRSTYQHQRESISDNRSQQQQQQYASMQKRPLQKQDPYNGKTPYDRVENKGIQAQNPWQNSPSNVSYYPDYRKQISSEGSTESDSSNNSVQNQGAVSYDTVRPLYQQINQNEPEISSRNLTYNGRDRLSVSTNFKSEPEVISYGGRLSNPGNRSLKSAQLTVSVEDDFRGTSKRPDIFSSKSDYDSVKIMVSPKSITGRNSLGNSGLLSPVSYQTENTSATSLSSNSRANSYTSPKGRPSNNREYNAFSDRRDRSAAVLENGKVICNAVSYAFFSHEIIPTSRS